MKQLLSVFLALTLLSGCEEIELPDHFLQLIGRTKMIFIVPEGFQQTEPTQSDKLNYDLAYIHPVAKFEIRYSIHPMDAMMKEYQENQAGPDSLKKMVNPNNLYQQSFKTALLNISGGSLPTYTMFSPHAAKNEFNADWGANAVVKVENELGNNYKYCFFVFIHKENIGDACIYCLSDDLNVLNKEMGSVIHNLKFNYE